MRYEYDFLVFVGRFQPFHYGHAKVIDLALQKAQHVIVLVGSAYSPRSWRNPFTFKERHNVIQSWMIEEGNHDLNRLIVKPLGDHAYNDTAWIQEVQKTVSEISHEHSKDPKIGLIGHSKDYSSYYLSLFPQWGSIDVDAYTDRELFNSTDVRHMYFDSTSEIQKSLPKATTQFLLNFKDTDAYNHLRAEHEYVIQYRNDHQYAKESIKYIPTHTAVDAVVVQSGHILLIKRRALPGLGLSALPGGFINPTETLQAGMIRELREETKVKVPEPVLIGNIKKREVFDDPNRSARGRIFSHAFLIVMPPDAKGLPKVKGGSDASKAWWEPLANLREEDFFEDHYFIIQCMTGIT